MSILDDVLSFAFGRRPTGDPAGKVNAVMEKQAHAEAMPATMASTLHRDNPNRRALWLVGKDN